MPKFFGYRRSMLGKPTCFTTENKDFVRNCVSHSVADPNYPYTRLYELKENELSLSLSELEKVYPYQPV